MIDCRNAVDFENGHIILLGLACVVISLVRTSRTSELGRVKTKKKKVMDGIN